MATSPPASRWPVDRAAHIAKLAVGALVSAIIGGFVAAYATYLFTAKLNNEAALQQQYLAAIQEFSATGARVDASVTGLADTVVDGTSIVEAKKEVRQAIAAHEAATQSLTEIVGEGNVEAYMVGLATLRTLVDTTVSPATALKTSRARFDLMSNRTMMVAEARRRVYGHT